MIDARTHKQQQQLPRILAWFHGLAVFTLAVLLPLACLLHCPSTVVLPAPTIGGFICHIPQPNKHGATVSTTPQQPVRILYEAAPVLLMSGLLCVALAGFQRVRPIACRPQTALPPPIPPPR